MLTEYKIK